MVKIFALIPALFLLAATGTALAEGPQDTWKITAPADGASTKASEVTVTVDPGQMKIVPPGAVVAGQGHWHFMVDGKEVGKGAANSFTYKDLTPGKHVLEVALHQGDHSPYPGDTGRKVTVNTGATGSAGTMAIYAVAGVAVLGAAGYLFARKRSVRVG
jgi:LPXTG-motif cell wall-anchored protein